MNIHSYLAGISNGSMALGSEDSWDYCNMTLICKTPMDATVSD